MLSYFSDLTAYVHGIGKITGRYEVQLLQCLALFRAFFCFIKRSNMLHTVYPSVTVHEFIW